MNVKLNVQTMNAVVETVNARNNNALYDIYGGAIRARFAGFQDVTALAIALAAGQLFSTGSRQGPAAFSG
jgi:hypothetical protein